jgi:hypothetical protein
MSDTAAIVTIAAPLIALDAVPYVPTPTLRVAGFFEGRPRSVKLSIAKHFVPAVGWVGKSGV